jgi:hypothetical protein
MTACGSPPPVQSSSGEAIEAIEIEERFALSSDARSSSLRGEKLKKALVILERHGLFAQGATFEDRSVVDSTTLTLVVRPQGAPERRIVVRNCAEPRVCAFFRDAAESAIVERAPAVCRAKNACDGTTDSEAVSDEPFEEAP